MNYVLLMRQLSSFLRIAYSRWSLGTGVSDACDLIEGLRFVNEVIEGFLQLFEIQVVLTLAQHPQVNALAKRNGAEVAKHLRALLLDNAIRESWSVLLPLVMRIINRPYIQNIGTTPHRLILWAPTDLDRAMFEPFREAKELLPVKSAYVLQLEVTYE